MKKVVNSKVDGKVVNLIKEKSMYDYNDFDIDGSLGGMSIKEIIKKNKLSDEEMIVILNDYKEMMENEGYGVEDYLFYENCDIKVLKRLGFVELIG
jgi:hypothetical protein